MMKSKFFQLDKAVDIVTEYSLEESISLIKQMDKLYGYRVEISPIKNDVVYSVTIRHSGFRQIPVEIHGEIEYLGKKQTRITGIASVTRSNVLWLLFSMIGVPTLLIFFDRSYYVILWMIVPIFIFIFIIQVGYAQEMMRDIIRQLDNILLTE